MPNPQVQPRPQTNPPLTFLAMGYLESSPVSPPPFLRRSPVRCAQPSSRTGGVVGLVVLCACCSLVCFKERKPQRVPVSRDVEAPVLHLDQIQAQADNLPASLPQAHTKIEVVGAAGEWELSPPPPPYYPVSRGPCCLPHNADLNVASISRVS